MIRIFTLLCGIAFTAYTAGAQLLTWTPDFPRDNDNISITVDASKGNQGLFNYATVSDV